MGTPGSSEPVKLVCAVMGRDETMLSRGRDLMAERYGEVELASPVFDFSFSSYYESEMGAGLVKQFFGFDPLVDPAHLSSVKRTSNDLETTVARSDGMPGREVNIDPGYVNGCYHDTATT